MSEFREKTGEAAPGAINAGAYVLERSLLELIPPGEQVSIEREVFPRLVGDGLYALPLDGYWMDFGTPERYLQATWDILEGRVATRVRPTAPGRVRRPRRRDRRRRRVGPRAVVARRLPGRGRREVRRLGPARRQLGRRGRPGRALDPRAAGRGRGRRGADGAVVGRDERVPAQTSIGPP